MRQAVKLAAGFGINTEKMNFGKNKIRNQFSLAMNLIFEVREIFRFCGCIYKNIHSGNVYTAKQINTG